MDLNDLRKLIQLMEEAGLVELEIEDRAGKVRLVRDRQGMRGQAGDPSSQGAAVARSAATRPLAPLSEEDLRGALDDGLPTAPEGHGYVLSPMVGTFYVAAGPDVAPFVAVGDPVAVGQVVCIVEAMKMMNEIHSEVSGRVVQVLVENGASVEYGSPLFVVELEG